MTKHILTSIFVFTLFLGFSQTFNTGDKEFDKQLVEENNSAKLDLSKFKNSVVSTFGTSVDKVESFLNAKLEPADILMAFKVSQIAKKPVDDVVNSYKTNKSKGWGYIAKEMGIKPGSAEFHELKNQGKSKGNGNGKGKKQEKSNNKGKGKK